jgi:hypothetical protein
MSSILDQVVQIAEEVTYSTFVSPTRAYEAQADTFTRDTTYLESVGMRRDLQTVRSDRNDTITLGATGSIETDVLTKGHGLLMKHMLGTSAGPVQQGATPAYLQTFSSDDTGPTTSYSTQVSRVDAGGTLRTFTYNGAIPTGFNITQSLDEATKMTIDFDAAEEVTSETEATPSYPSSADVFDFTMATVQINDSGVHSFTSFSLDADLAMKTDRRFLKGSAVKSIPKRSSVPTYTGTIEGEFEDLTQFAAFTAGTTFKLEFDVSYPTAISGAYYPHLHVTLPVCKWTGSTPVASLDDMTTISLPYTCLFNGTDAAVTIEYMSTDTTF